MCAVSSFDYLVGASKHARWNVEADRLSGPEIDDEFMLHRRLHW